MQKRAASTPVAGGTEEGYNRGRRRAEAEMRRVAPAWALAAAAAAALSPIDAGRASARIDTANIAAHRRAAEACVLRGVVIYTDPYVSRGLSNGRIVGDIARMCAAPFRLYSEDLGIASGEARRLARRLIEAGLRGQFRQESGWPPLRGAR
jgi:hypothetical protein